MSKLFTCPRRVEDGMADIGPLLGSGPDLDRWEWDNSCSYCGSMNPDVFIALIEDDKVTLGPTDKSYKVYLHGLDHHAKFYFQHLSKEQQQQFVDLLNAKKVKMSYPGYFYRLPFFIKADTKAKE